MHMKLRSYRAHRRRAVTAGQIALPGRERPCWCATNALSVLTSNLSSTPGPESRAAGGGKRRATLITHSN